MVKKTFFYPLCGGFYLCDDRFLVKRNKFENYLLMYCKSGEGFVTTKGTTYHYGPGMLVSIDLSFPHEYGTSSLSELYWFRFDGSSSEAYIQLLQQSAGPVCMLIDPIQVEREMIKIVSALDLANENEDADIISCSIVRILTEGLVSSKPKKDTASMRDEISETITYIRDHIMEKLSIEELSCRVHLTPHYFGILFKRKTGHTLHSYIIACRINFAKYQLATTNLSVKEICFSCGFSSESNFCLSFKKQCGESPLAYRNRLKTINLS